VSNLTNRKTPFKVFNVGSSYDGSWILNSKQTNDVYEADIITFPGGSDINPALYGQKVGSYTWASDHCDQRDLKYLKDPKLANVFKVGLCRGAQLLTAHAGGKLIQHFASHNGGHDVIINDNPDILISVNSLHHQMMYPFDMPKNEYIVIGSAYRTKVKTFLDENNKEVDMPRTSNGIIEPEIVFYPRIKGLGFQFHPEMMSWNRDYATLTYCNTLLNQLFDEYDTDKE